MLVSVYTGHESAPSSGRQEHFIHSCGAGCVVHQAFLPQSVHTADSTLTEQIPKEVSGFLLQYHQEKDVLDG